MKRNLLKIISFILCISMLTAPLAGCSQKDSDGDNNNPNADSMLPKLNKTAGTYTDYQLEQIREKIAAKEEPWYGAYKDLTAYIKTHFNDNFVVDEDFNVPGYYNDAEGHTKAKERLNAIGCMAYSCALAYVLDGTPKYAAKAVTLLNDWASKNKKISGDDGTLAMSYVGPSLVFAAELLTASGGWSGNVETTFKTWVKSVFIPTANSIRERDNNWGDWGMLASVASYNYLGETEEVENCMLMIRKRIENTILPTGEMPHETKREGNGVWYTYFALAPMTAACNIINNATGFDLYTYEGKDGQCIKKALDYLLYYYQNPEEWPHYDGNLTFETGKTYWPYNLFEAMGVVYGEESYTKFAQSHGNNEATGHHYAWNFTTLTTIE